MQPRIPTVSFFSDALCKNNWWTHLAELFTFVVWQKLTQTLESSVDALHTTTLVAVWKEEEKKSEWFTDGSASTYEFAIWRRIFFSSWSIGLWSMDCWRFWSCWGWAMAWIIIEPPPSSRFNLQWEVNGKNGLVQSWKQAWRNSDL